MESGGGWESGMNMESGGGWNGNIGIGDCGWNWYGNGNPNAFVPDKSLNSVVDCFPVGEGNGVGAVIPSLEFLFLVSV